MDAGNLRAGRPASKKDGCLIEVVDYREKSYRSYTADSGKPGLFAELADIPRDHVRWINIDGQCPEPVLQKLGRAFGIHPLIIRDLFNRTQRAKIEEYQKCLYSIIFALSKTLAGGPFREVLAA